MFEAACLDCGETVTFTGRPADATCPGCGLRMYVNAAGAVGRYPDDGWEPGRMQGRSR